MTKDVDRRTFLKGAAASAAIVAPSADLHLAVRAIAFAAMGTAGQRCTTLRRLFAHDNVYERLVPRLSQIYASAKVGDPREAATLVGPLIDRRAFESMQRTLQEARAAGGVLHGGERVAGIGGENAYYVRPALCEGRVPLSRASRSELVLDGWRRFARGRWRSRAASHPRTSLRSSRSPFPGKSDFRVQRQNGHNVRRGRVRESRDQVDRAGRRQYVGIWGRSPEISAVR